MTLIQLEYILAVHSLKHFGKAAERCHVTQPSLSVQVRNLEQELGLQIFIRSTPVSTTEMGLLIVEQAQKILTESDALKQLVAIEKGIVGGHLKLAVIPTLAPYLLPLFIQPFIKAYPGVRLTIRETTTENIVRGLKNGSLDAGILATPLHVPEIKEEFLFNEEFVAYVSPKEKIFTKKYLLPSDIDINRMWLLEEGHCLRNQVMNLCALQKNASIEKHLDYTAGSIETLKRFVHKNGGITLLPELAALDMSHARKNMLRYFRKPAPVREISLLSLKTFPKTRLLTLLKEMILDHLPPQMLQERDVKRINIS